VQQRGDGLQEGPRRRIELVLVWTGWRSYKYSFELRVFKRHMRTFALYTKYMGLGNFAAKNA
jgi:hypothetical protein